MEKYLKISLTEAEVQPEAPDAPKNYDVSIEGENMHEFTVTHVVDLLLYCMESLLNYQTKQKQNGKNSLQLAESTAGTENSNNEAVNDNPGTDTFGTSNNGSL